MASIKDIIAKTKANVRGGQTTSTSAFRKELLQVHGVDEIMLNIRRVDADFKRNIRRGLKRAGLLLQRMSQKIVPIDTGNLKASAGTRVDGQGWKTEAYVFYTAEYAVYVHERTDLEHAEGKQAKFLEDPARINRKELIRAVAQEFK